MNAQASELNDAQLADIIGGKPCEFQRQRFGMGIFGTLTIDTTTCGCDVSVGVAFRYVGSEK